MSLCSIKVVLIPGLIGLPRRESYRVVPIRPESQALVEQRKELICGIAVEKQTKVILMEFGTKTNRVRTNFGAAWRKTNGEAVVVHFAKCYLNHLSSWHLAALIDELGRQFPQAEQSQLAYVYNVEPILLGGTWKDCSPFQSRWIKFQPYLKPESKEIPQPKEPRSAVSPFVLQQLRSSGVSEGFIEDLIALRAREAARPLPLKQKGA